MRTILFIICLIPSFCFGQLTLPVIGDHLEILQTSGTTGVVFLNQKSDTLYTNYTLDTIEENIDSVGAKFLVTATKKDSLLVLAIGSTIRDSVKVDSIKRFIEPIKDTWIVDQEKSLILNEMYHLVRLKRKAREKKQWLEICIEEGKCQSSVLPLIQGYSCTDFEVLFKETLNKLSNEGTVLKTTIATRTVEDNTTRILNDICEKFKDESRVQRINLANASSKDSIAKILSELTRENAGIIRMEKEIEVEYHSYNEENCKKKWYQFCKKKDSEDNCKDHFKVSYHKFKYDDNIKMIFKPQTVWFRTKFYKVSDVLINGWVSLGKDSTEVEITNDQYGFNLNGLVGIHNHEFSLTKDIRIKDKTYNVKFYFGDILNYIPSGNSFSQFIVDAEHTLTIESNEFTLKKRKINDFVSATIFTDALGFINEKRGSVLQTEVSATLPFNMKNNGQRNWLPAFKGTLNIGIVNGFGENINVVKPFFEDPIFSIVSTNDSTLTPINLDDTTLFVMIPTERLDTNLIYPDTGYINSIDMLRNADIDFSFKSRILSYEIKGFNSFLNIDAGCRLYRSKVDMSPNLEKSDIRSKFIYSPDIELSISLRPETRTGADFALGYHRLYTFNQGSPSAPELMLYEEIDRDFIKQTILRTEINLYYLTSNENQGGLFFRYRGYHGFHRSGTFKKLQFFPSLLFGYSTNLSTVVKGRKE